jgi:PPOX class probable F420-dependent enzyme
VREERSESVKIDEARAFLSVHHRAVMATRRRDGRPQLTPVSAGIDAEGRGIVSSTETTAKVANLWRDPWVSLCVTTERFFGAWVTVEGRATIVQMPEALEPLVDYYRRVAGKEHPDWDDYRRAMREDRRVLIRIDLERAVGP